MRIDFVGCCLLSLDIEKLIAMELSMQAPLTRNAFKERRSAGAFLLPKSLRSPHQERFVPRCSRPLDHRKRW